jgi:hypothetical protein
MVENMVEQKRLMFKKLTKQTLGELSPERCVGVEECGALDSLHDLSECSRPPRCDIRPGT